MTTTMTTTPPDCLRYLRVTEAISDEELLTESDERYREQHERQCAECRLVAQATQAIRWDALDAPCEPLDEVSTRRVVQAVLAAGASLDEVTPEPAAPGRGAEVPAEALSPSRRRPGRAFLGGRRLVAAAAGLAAVLVAMVLLWPRSPQRGFGDGQLLRAPSRALARVTLVSGTVHAKGGSAGIGDAIHAGESVRVSRGQAALHLSSGAALLLQSGTTVRMTGSSKGRVDITLERGELLAVVPPRRDRPELVVSTASGEVIVTGTIFSVSVTAARTEAAVLRGTVRVVVPGGLSRHLTRGHRLSLGSPAVLPIGEERSRLYWQRTRLLRLLQVERAAHLVIDSQPSGAAVLVDGLPIGFTPLTAALKEGQRSLELQLTGYTPIAERLILEAERTHHRDFVLKTKPSIVTDAGHSHPSIASGRKAGSARAPKTMGSATPRDTGWRDLLRTAQVRRAAQDWRGAAHAYRTLIQRYPRRGEAGAALVSLGFIQLEHLGQASSALRTFSRYLARSRRGALAREAAWGRIRALGALGRKHREVSALRQFVRQYPRSVYRGRAVQRLQKLSPGK